MNYKEEMKRKEDILNVMASITARFEKRVGRSDFLSLMSLESMKEDLFYAYVEAKRVFDNRKDTTPL